jgi:hypothetical protein
MQAGKLENETFSESQVPSMLECGKGQYF